MANKKKSEKSDREVGRRSLATRPSSRGTGVVRISAGMWRQSPLAVPDAVGLRPTPDRVRGTLFDWVRHLLGDLAGCRVLDLFAGSGVLGFEAASRGAASVDWVERHRGAVASLRKNVEKFGAADHCRVHAGDAFEFLARTKETFDLVFIDPPYDANLQEKALAAALPRLSEAGLLYVETPNAYLPEEKLASLGLVLLRGSRAGVVHYQLLTRIDSPLATLAKPLKEEA